MRNPLWSLLQSCMKAKALRPGKQIHAQFLATGMGMETDSLNAKLVGMYAGSGDVQSAQQVFEYMSKPSVFAWNWMISALAFQGDCENAMRYFSCMRKDEAVFPNKFTFSFVLKACVGLLDLKKGEELHCLIDKLGFAADVSVVNALIDMYGKCGRLELACKLFDVMPERDVASWTSMISGYCSVRKPHEAIALLERMSLDGIEPNEFTWNVVISGYASQGDCVGAYELFSRMRSRGLTPDLVTWNAMISGFARSNKNTEAVTLFGRMLCSGLKPNQVTIAGLLPACGEMGDIQTGKQVNGMIYRRCLSPNIFTATALIDMYSKCGYVLEASKVFQHIEVKTAVVWNAMIGCFRKHGLVDECIMLFNRMNVEGVQANQITYTSLLSACSHAGYVDKGLDIFKLMEEKGDVQICEEHYACVVDILCRSGKLMEAYELMKRMPVNINDSMVGAFFNGCKLHGQVEFAKKMAEEILGMELTMPGGFVTLSNIYAADGEWEWVENVRKVMKEKGVRKKAGFCQIKE